MEPIRPPSIFCMSPTPAASAYDSKESTSSTQTISTLRPTLIPPSLGLQRCGYSLYRQYIQKFVWADTGYDLFEPLAPRFVECPQTYFTRWLTLVRWIALFALFSQCPITIQDPGVGVQNAGGLGIPAASFQPNPNAYGEGIKRPPKVWNGRSSDLEIPLPGADHPLRNYARGSARSRWTSIKPPG